MQNAGRGIWRKFSGLSREIGDGWSPYYQHKGLASKETPELKDSNYTAVPTLTPFLTQ
jgi:hypothetical protein